MAVGSGWAGARGPRSHEEARYFMPTGQLWAWGLRCTRKPALAYSEGKGQRAAAQPRRMAFAQPPFPSILLSLSFNKKGVPFLKGREREGARERETVNCPKGPWENRKLWKVQEKARWNLFAGGPLGTCEALLRGRSYSYILPSAEEALLPRGCYLVTALTPSMPASPRAKIDPCVSGHCSTFCFFSAVVGRS